MKAIKLLALSLVLALGGIASATEHDIYPDPAQAKADLAAALRQAAATHKRILLDFGGNWCPDCHVLDFYLNDGRSRTLVEANFVLVHINVGHLDENVELAAKYQIPIAHGVPALAVLSDKGTLLFSQKSGNFYAMHHMDSSAVTSFLVQWKPAREGCSAVMVNC
jgi:thiol:disulfide interchange protein